MKQIGYVVVVVNQLPNSRYSWNKVGCVVVVVLVFIQTGSQEIKLPNSRYSWNKVCYVVVVLVVVIQTGL